MFVSRLLDAADPGVSAHELLAQLSPETISATSEYYAGRIDAERIRRLLARYDTRETSRPRIDCNYKLTWILPVLRERYPEARILHLVRDPRDNVTSCYNLDYFGSLVEHPAFQTDPSRIEWMRGLPEVRRPDWGQLSQLEQNCVFWTESHRLALELATQGPYLRVRLEDLADDVIAARIFSFFGLAAPPPERMAELRRSRVNLKLDEKAEVRALKADVLPEFSAWQPAQQRALARQCGEMARRLGYAIED
jgi:hypothetical protein